MVLERTPAFNRGEPCVQSTCGSKMVARNGPAGPPRGVQRRRSAGGQLALCLAVHEPSVSRVISLAGVVDLKKGFALHLSSDAVAEFLGGKPGEVPEHYREADPMELKIPQAQQ